MLGRKPVGIGRDDEVKRCVQVLVRRRKNNPVLLGAAGLLYAFTKLLVGPRRPGVRRGLLPMFPLTGLAAGLLYL